MCSILPTHVIGHIASFLPLNYIPATLRLVSKVFAEYFQTHVRVRLSKPVPYHAFIWRWCSPASMRPLSLQQRVQLLCLTAASGCLDNLAAALEAAGWDPASGWEPRRLPGVAALPFTHVSRFNLLAAAAEAGHLHVCQWLRQRGCPWESALLAAAIAGKQGTCAWLLENGCPWDSRAISCAAQGGDTALVRWFQKRYPIHVNQYYEYLEAVAHGCDLDTLQEVHRDVMEVHQSHQQGDQQQLAGEATIPERQRVDIMAAVASSPTADFHAKLKWLEDLGYPRTEEVCSAAARCRDAADRLAWLRQRGYRVDHRAVREAAKCGSVDALRCLLTKGSGIAVDSGVATHMAAAWGHVEALQMLYSRGWPVYHHGATEAAVRGGHLAVVVWLVEVVGVNLPRLDSELLNAAAASGNMELVVWLRGQGCPLDARVWKAAASGGCEAMLEWLVQLGCPMPWDGQPYRRAARAGDLATLRCLRRLGCPWGGPGKLLGECGAPLSALSWLVEEGWPVDAEDLAKWVSDRDSMLEDRAQAEALLEKMRQRQGQGKGKGQWLWQHNRADASGCWCTIQ